MKIKFDVTSQELAIIQQVLQNTLRSYCKVWVFGSRAKHQAKYNSDLDLAIEGKQALDKTTLMQLEARFDESRLPYSVDIVDMRKVEPYFKEIIDQQKVVFPVKLNVPELRFAEFNKELDKRRLGDSDIATFSKGKGISKADVREGGETPCVRYGELYTHYGDVIETVISSTNVNRSELLLSNGNEVIVPASGETPTDIATSAVIKNSGVALGGDLNVISFDGDGHFLASYLGSKKRIELARLSQGNSVVHLYSAQLKSLFIYLPSLIEQQKIAAFLGSVDDKLNKLRRKRELLETWKRGLMQKIFSQQLRFTKDDGADFPGWQNKRLGDIAGFTKGKGISKLDISENGATECIRYGELYTHYGETINEVKSKTNVDLSELVLSRANDVIIPASGETRIDIATASCVVKEGVSLGGDLNVIRSNVNGVFLSYYFNSYKKIDIARMAQGISVMHLYSGQLKLLKVEVPSLDEQQKIASFLSAIDKKTEAVTHQIKQTETFKKGLLQKMFV